MMDEITIERDGNFKVHGEGARLLLIYLAITVGHTRVILELEPSDDIREIVSRYVMTWVRLRGKADVRSFTDDFPISGKHPIALRRL